MTLNFLTCPRRQGYTDISVQSDTNQPGRQHPHQGPACTLLPDGMSDNSKGLPLGQSLCRKEGLIFQILHKANFHWLNVFVPIFKAEII